MASSDDDSDFGPKSVSNYHFVDDDDAPTSFSVLPLYWSESENVDCKKKEQIFVHGSADNGLQKIHKEVIAWKFDLSNAKPEISVLTKEKNWIKLEKPRKSFEEIIRTVLITVQCLHFASRNPDASDKSVWDHLSKVFSLYEVKPSQNDLVDHMDVISKALERYKSLAKSKFLLAFVNKKPRKRKLSNEDFKPTTMSGFIADDVDDDMLEDIEDGDEDEDIYDSVCAFCDNGGDIICCDGICLRSFHQTVEDGIDSQCVSLGFSKREVEAINNFYCKNCEYKQHQCFACGELGSSDKSSGAEVFQCGSATCGHFYHPHCVAKLLYPDDEVAAEELQKNIAAGHSFFTCPMHKCTVCRQGEDKQIKELQFAVCRRCPTSYHRKCLPKEIGIEKKDDDEEEEEEEEEDDDDVETRAWEGLLPGRLLLYCLKHEIDDELLTPIRDIRFPSVTKTKEHIPEFRGSSGKVLSDKRQLILKDSFPERNIVKEKWESSEKKVAKLKRSESISSGSNSSRKVKESDASRKSSKGSMIADATEVKRFGKDSKTSLGDRLFSLVIKSSEGKLGKQEMLTSEPDDTMTPKASTRKLNSESSSLDADAERRISALMKDVESSMTLEDVIRKRKAPSTHSSVLKQVVEKTITAGRVEAAVQAMRTALEKIEAGCSPEDAKAICEPEVLHQIFKWKNKLSVYLAPFLRGKRYTSFGRHFTKIEKLEKIVDSLHWYVKDGDMIVDFCCGANDFSCLLKKKLEETGKECLYKNYDLIQPKIDFNFEKRDWLKVNPDELPKRGSQLIMGLNPPFGVKAALANRFINHALKFKPKLLILIVPPETERLDQKNPPYDLIWEDNQCLSGKSFYLPGSIDENDKQMEQWNLTTPPLYLWSRRDWSARHMAIAQKHGHLAIRQEGSSLENCLYDGNASELTDQLHMQNKELSHKESVTEGHRECSPRGNIVRENRDSRAPERKQSKETLGKRKHGEYELGGGINEKLPENIWDGRKSPQSGSYKRVQHHSSPKVVDGRSAKEGAPSKSRERADAVENRVPNPEHRRSSSRKSVGSDSYKGMHHHFSSKVVDRKSSRESTSSKSPEMLWHANAVDDELHNSEHRKSSSDMSLDSNSTKGMPHYSSSKVVAGRSSHESTTSKSPEVLLHAASVGNRLPNLDHRSSTSRKSPASGSYRGMPHRSREGNTSKASEILSHAEAVEDRLPNLEHRNSRSHMQSGRASGNSTCSIRDDVSLNYSMNYNDNSRDVHGFSCANIDYHSSGGMRESTESVGFRSYPTELVRDLGVPSQDPRYGQDPDYSAQRNYTVGSHEPAYGHMGSLSSIPYGHLGPDTEAYRMNMPAMQPATESYRMNMNMPGVQPAVESYRTNMSAMQRYAPRLDELNHTRMNNMGPDPSMINRSGMYHPPPPQPGYHVDSMGFAPGPRNSYSHHNSSGWLDE